MAGGPNYHGTMCGRYSLTVTKVALLDRFRGDATDLLHQPRYNIAPSQTVPVLTRSAEGGRWRSARWGIPISAGRRVINARVETVEERPLFRRLLAERRCLVPSDGFYEWPRSTAAGKARQPHRFVLRGGGLFAFAGLWAESDSPDEPPVFVILTTRANSHVARLHGRMPVILRRELEGAWLDPSRVWPDLKADIAAPYPAEDLDGYAVSTRVNDPRLDAPDCIAPFQPEEQRELW